MSHHGYQPSYRNKIQMDKTMDLFIETLTGTAFEMTVSPFDTVMSIKSKIQRVEGIPVSHQHLLYNTQELDDASCLIDYSIQDGATLKLVLSMRGGPISTRRLPVGKEIAWKEHLRELVEGRQDESKDRVPPGTRVTLFVFGEGSQMNLVRVIENDDGSYTPLSESWSGSSIRNLFAEDDPELANRRLQENSVTMGKMQDLQHKMEMLTMQRKPKNSPTMVYSPSRPAPSRRPRNAPPDDAAQLLELRNVPNLLQFPQLVEKIPAPCLLDSSHLLHDNHSLLEAADKRKDYRLSRRESKNDGSGRRPARGGILLDVKPKLSEALPNHFRDVKKPVMDRETVLPNMAVGDAEVGATEVSLSRDRLVANGSGHRYRASQYHADCGADGRPVMTDAWRRHVVYGIETRATGFGHDNDAVDVVLRSPRYGRRSLGVPFIAQDKQEPYRPTMSDDAKPAEERPDREEAKPDREESYREEANPDGGESRPAVSDAAVGGKKAPSVRVRCAECKKRLNITNMYTCRCGQLFCAAHRHCEAHQCTFDYKTHGRRQLQEANPLVSAPKLPKI